jgi:hypothetical protein
MSFKKYSSNVKCLTVTEEEVEELYTWVNRFTAASHLQWALWAVVQASQSSLHFDFLE